MNATAAHYHQSFGQSHVDDLRRCGYTTFLFPGMHDDSRRVFDGVELLVGMNAEQQRMWASDYTHDNQVDEGLLPQDEHEDPKRVFHYTASLRKVLCKNGVDVGKWDWFLEANERIFTRNKQLAAKVYAEFGIGQPEGPMMQRCVRYEPTEVATETAASHWDRAAFSVHDAESDAGLELPLYDAFGPEEPTFRLMERASHDIVHAFFGAKMAGASNGALPACWHRARATVRRKTRFALIGFDHANLSDQVLPPGYMSKRREPLARLMREHRQRQTAVVLAG